MSSARAFLIAQTSALLLAEPSVESRVIVDDDLHELAQLFIDAYAGSVDDEGETLDDAHAHIRGLVAGDAGEPMREAWLGIYEDEGPPLSAILCTTWRGMPFIAQVVTQPSYRQRGHATSLIREIARTVEASGGSAVGLMVTRTNPALHLYQELGFQELVAPAGVE